MVGATYDVRSSDITWPIWWMLKFISEIFFRFSLDFHLPPSRRLIFFFFYFRCWTEKYEIYLRNQQGMLQLHTPLTREKSSDWTFLLLLDARWNLCEFNMRNERSMEYELVIFFYDCTIDNGEGWRVKSIVK